MSLPKCVRIDCRDIKSALALAEDGWREIGICDQYNGKVEGMIRGATTPHDVRPILTRLSEYGFSGRLWRDPEIKNAEAEIRKFVQSAGDRLFAKHSGFGIFTRNGETLRIDLIGCLEPGKGVAQDIIRSAIHHFETSELEAGTYSDNIPARELYLRLGMKIYVSERVFHK